MNDAKVYLLLGGLFGGDGIVDSRGMLDLGDQLKALGFPVTTFYWSDYEKVDQEPLAGKRIVIGFSGGGSRATWLIRHIDLMVLYDPSPAWQMKPCGKNVAKAISYHNTAPMMGNLGGGVLTGPQVTSIDIAEPHLEVQHDAALHKRTIEACEALIKDG